MKRLAAIGPLLYLLAACSPAPVVSPSPTPTPAPTDPTPTTSFFSSLPNWPEPQPAQPATPTGTNTANETRGGVPVTCTTTGYSLRSRHDEIVTLEPDAAHLWLGNLLQGQDIQRGLGSLREVPVEPPKRQTLTLSINQAIPNPSRTVAEPSLSSVRAAVGELIRDAQNSGIALASSTLFT